MNESLKRMKAWAHWKTIEFNNIGMQIPEDRRQDERIFIEDITNLCQAVVDAEEIMTLLKPIFHKMICEPDNCHCKAQISNQWISRYAGEEKKDE